MKDRRMVSQALVSMVMLVALVLPASVPGASATAHPWDEPSDSRSVADVRSDVGTIALSSIQGQVKPMVTAGFLHTVGLRADGNVVAVGFDRYGQCQVGDWTDIVQVTAGSHHTVGLKSDGTVVAVGDNASGQCQVSDWTGIVQVDAGWDHTVGLRYDGTVTVVGSNQYGQCQVGDWTDIVRVATGGFHTAGIMSDGTVIAVGRNHYGQCQVDDWTDIVQVTAGRHHTVGLKSDGTVVAVGDNTSGQCQVGDWTDIVQVTAGSHHTAGLKSDGTVIAVGSNDSGQCQVGDWTDIVQVAAGSHHTVGLKSDGMVVVVGWFHNGQCNVDVWMDIVQLATGDAHTIGLDSNGTMVAVGYNGHGQCDVGDWSGIVQVAAGHAHTAGLGSGATVLAVGLNHHGQCEVGHWTGIVQVTAGSGHTVGLRSDGTVVAAGWNAWGQSNVAAWTGMVQVAAGYGHTVGLSSAGTVFAVGNNQWGQCQVDGLAGIVQVAAGSHHTVGLKSDGTVVAVGVNEDGQCNVGGWTSIVQVAAGFRHTVGLKSDGTVVAVGDRYDDREQVDLTGWMDIIEVAAGHAHTVGLKSDGTVVAVSLETSIAAWNLGETQPLPGPPRFLTMPSHEVHIKIQQGWRYTAPIGPDPDDPYAHNGIDYIKGIINEPATWQSFHVVAAAGGVAMWSSGGGYGDFVLIRHDETDTEGRNYFTLYGHLGDIEESITYRADRFATDYQNWTPVARGQKIGIAGATGVTDPTWVHLHFEVQRGAYAQNKVDPYDIFSTRGCYPGGSAYAGCGDNALWVESVCPAPDHLRFAIGDWVCTTANLNVREGPGLANAILSTMPLGAVGQILGGPVHADGFFWWELDYVGKVEGWSAENWLKAAVSRAPTCAIELQRNGDRIDEVGIWQSFDIYAGDSASDIGIDRIRFSSDSVRDGYPTGEWTEWFDWNTSQEGWNAATRVKSWAFDTPGYKEVWIEAEDEMGNTGFCHATIFVPAPALPVLVSQLVITPKQDIYNAGDLLEAEFTIVNTGGLPITLDILTVGGRLNGFVPPEGSPDFTYRSVTLLPQEPYSYQGELELDHMGHHQFFVSYHIENPAHDEKRLLDDNNWSTSIDLGDGLTHKDRTKSIVVYAEGVVPEEPAQLRKQIDSFMISHRQWECPVYLRNVDSFTMAVGTLWSSFTSFVTRTDLTKLYNDLYWTGFDYQQLSYLSTIKAGLALDGGDVETARRCMETSHMYWRLSAMSFQGAAAVFEGNLKAGEIFARGIKDGCQAAVKFGVSIVYPPAAAKVDAIYSAIDFAVTAKIDGVSQAAKDLATEQITKWLLKDLTFTSLGGSTLETYVNSVAGDLRLDTLLADQAFMTEFGRELGNIINDRAIEEVLGSITGEVVEAIVEDVIDDLESLVSSVSGKVRSPVKLMVIDSVGRATGLTDMGVRHDIPMSFYDGGMVEVSFPSDVYRYEVVGRDEGVYGLDITYFRGTDATAFSAEDFSTSPDAIHRFSIDWAALAQGEDGITIEKDHDGDGEIDETIITGVPQKPSDPSPMNNATAVSLDTTLSWTGDDSESVTYSVYFGTSMDPLLVSERQAERTYLPILQPYTRYYWRVAAFNEYSISTTGAVWSFVTDGAGIAGEIRGVNCDVLDGVSIALYRHGEVVVPSASIVDGSYTVGVLDPDQYELVASKDGYRDVTQWIDITEVGREYELHFRADHGLIPNAPNMSYVLACINLWQYGSPYCQLTMSTVLAVINAWQFPIAGW